MKNAITWYKSKINNNDLFVSDWKVSINKNKKRTKLHNETTDNISNSIKDLNPLLERKYLSINIDKEIKDMKKNINKPKKFMNTSKY